MSFAKNQSQDHAAQLNARDSLIAQGSGWLSGVPSTWDTRRVKEIGTLIGGAGFPEDYQGKKDLELPFFKVVDLGLIGQGEKLTEAANTIDRTTARKLGATIIRPGDIAFAKVGAALLLNRFRMVGVECCIDNNMMAFRPETKISSDFALCGLSRIDFADIVNPGAVPSVNSRQVGRIEIALPTPETQRRIAQFLDEKTARIDGLIEKKRALLARLAEKRQALITRAVTKGLNSTGFTDYGEAQPCRVVGRVGGMNLLEVVPNHWIKASVGKYCDVQLGKMLQSDPASEQDELKRYLRAINIAKHGLDLSHDFSMWIKPQEMEKFRLQRGDILVSEGGDAGRTAVFDCDEEFYFQNAINRVRPAGNATILPEFIYYWFTFLKVAGYVEMVCNVATIAHFTAEKVKAAPLALPPLKTQRRIAQFLDEKTAHIVKQAEQIEDSISLLNEYRGALITSAVTGQIGGLQ